MDAATEELYETIWRLMTENPSLAILAEREMAAPVEELIDPIFLLEQYFTRYFFMPELSNKEKAQALWEVCGYLAGSVRRRIDAGENADEVNQRLLREISEAIHAAKRHAETRDQMP